MNQQARVKCLATPRSLNKGKGLLHKESGNNHSIAMSTESLPWAVPEHILSMAHWRCTRCWFQCSFANTREKGGPARVCFPHLLPFLVSVPGQSTSVHPREEVLGWHSSVRWEVSLRELAGEAFNPSQEICAWYLCKGGQYTTSHGHCEDSSPLLLFAAPCTSSALDCQN